MGSMVFKWIKKLSRSPKRYRDDSALIAVTQQVAAAALTATPPPVRTMAPPPARPAEITSEMIAQRAYEIWVRKGRPAGTADQDWLDAEAQLRAELHSRCDYDTLSNQSR
jgi:hypothetical protein